MHDTFVQDMMTVHTENELVNSNEECVGPNEIHYQNEDVNDQFKESSEERVGQNEFLFHKEDSNDQFKENESVKSTTDTNPSSVSTESETKLQISQNSESEKSTDTPDSGSPPVYRPVTQPLIEPDGKKTSFLWSCCCCGNIVSAWKRCNDYVSDFSSRQWRLLIMLLLGTLTSSLSVCLFPPFFPKLAESKGESASIYGMVIGTNCLTAFIVTPIIGKNMEKIGVNVAFAAGMFCSGACCCLSGCLEFFSPGYKFVLVSICIRILHATANAGVITSTIAFIAGEFPASVAFLFSLTRATMNLAQMFGPVLGGALHNVGGFKMPFFVLGSLQIVVSLICACFLPTYRGKPKKEQETGEKKQIWSIIKIPGLWISFLTFIFSTMSNGFLSITLEPRILRKFNISPVYVGLLFGLKDGANCFASPVWGWMCDRMKKLKILIIVGSVMAALSFILLGPFPGLPIHHTIIIVIISLILNGFGVGGQQVAGVVSAMKDTVNAGFPDEADTHAFVAGLWSSLSGIGRFISRAGSGILVDTIGFQFTSTIVTGLHLCILSVTWIYVCFSKKSDEDVSNGRTRRKSMLFVETNSPSEPLGSKSAEVAIPVIREDLEGSFLIGSAASQISKRNSFGHRI